MTEMIWVSPREAFISQAPSFDAMWLCYPSVTLWDSGKELWWYARDFDPTGTRISVINPGDNPVPREWGARDSYARLEVSQPVRVEMPTPVLVDTFEYYDNTYLLWQAEEINQEHADSDVDFFFVSKTRFENPIGAFTLPKDPPPDQQPRTFHAAVELLGSDDGVTPTKSPFDVWKYVASRQWLFSYVMMLPKGYIPAGENRIGLQFAVGFKDGDPFQWDIKSDYPPGWVWEFTKKLEISLIRDATDPHISLNPLDYLCSDWTTFPDEQFFFVIEYPDGHLASDTAKDNEVRDYLNKYCNILSQPEIGGYAYFWEKQQFNNERRLP